MKTKLLLFAAASLCAPGMLLAESQSGLTQPVSVTVNSEATELAQGYAKSSELMSRRPVTLVFRKDNATYTLEDVRSVRAFGGVIAVEVGQGLLYSINARDVVFLTEGSPLKPQAASTSTSSAK